MDAHQTSMLINNNYATPDTTAFQGRIKIEPSINLDSKDFVNDPASSMVASSSTTLPATTTKIVTIPRVTETFSSDLKVI
jgi:hypothetical protein